MNFSEISMLTSLFFVFLLALLMRLVPVLISPHGSGVDQWYWRTYIETLRRDGSLPVKMPQYLLDEGHWYPPFFPWLMARLPELMFDRFSVQFAVFIDMLRMVLLVWAAWWLTGDIVAVVVAGMVYAITPLLITYNMQLNPRGMGALFLDAMFLLVGAVLLQEISQWFWLAVFFLAGLVMITHKMAMQLFWFIALVGAGIAGDLRLALLVPGSVIAALILSGGFYRLTMRAHWDTVKFWSRNWKGNGVHPLLESPVYGEAGYETPGKFYRSGLKAWIRRLQFVIGFNPWMPIVLAVGVVALIDGNEFSSYQVLIYSWLALTFCFALLTTLVPVFRSLGQGYLYGYNGSFPAALALGVSWSAVGNTWYWWCAVFIGLLMCVSALMAFLRALRTSRTMKVDSSLDEAISRLAVLEDGPVMCFPQHWHDVVAYRTGKQVLFGGHGYGYHLLEPIFPVLRVPVRKIFEQYQVRYMLTYDGYLPVRFCVDLPPAEVETFGDYRLYKFTASQEIHYDA